MRKPRLRAAARTALAAVLCGFLTFPSVLWAGGPLSVGGPASVGAGNPFTWDVGLPVPYRVDAGPLSRTPLGVQQVNNSSGVARVQAMFRVWEDVPTSSIRFTNAGRLLNAGAFFDDDVDSVWEFDDVFGSCLSGNQSPIIFDADGFLFSALVGDPGVIGFAGPCQWDPATGRIVAGLAVLNGIFQDGVDSGQNFELTADEFDTAFIHEFGHFAGLDHSQINVNCLGTCGVDDLDGLPTLFPFLLNVAQKSLAPDDISWISQLYPETVNAPPTQVAFTSAYGMITGVIYFSDGITPVQGVNVIARQANSPTTPENESRRIAVSAVSGYRFTGNLGQSATCLDPANPTLQTCTNLGGSSFGSRNVSVVGFFELAVPLGNYTVEVESIQPFFIGGSGIGPLPFPIPSPGPAEFWDTGESAKDSPSVMSTIAVTAGSAVSGIDIILNNTPTRFDAFESARLKVQESRLVWARRQEFELGPKAR